MKVFITGGTGAIGQYVTLEVAGRGHEVTVLSRTPDKYAQMLDIPLSGVSSSSGGSIKIVKGLMTEYDLMAEYVKGNDAVISIALGWGNEPVSMLTNDTMATVNLLEISEKAGVGMFIFTSSTAAMGNCLPGINETFCNMPTDLYGSTKSAIEAYVIGFRKYFPNAGEEPKMVTMKRNVIRPGYTFGTPCFPGGTVQLDPRFRNIAKAVVNNEPVKLTKHDGTQFLSGAQIAKVYADILESDLNEEIFLALAAEFMTWERIAEIALDLHPESTSTIEVEDKGWDSTPTLYGVDKVKRFFGHEFRGEDEVRAHMKWSLENAMQE